MRNQGSPKTLNLSSNTELHMTTEYRRNVAPVGKKSKKEKIMRNFNFVIKGLLISSALVGAFISTASNVYASTPNAEVPVPTTAITQQYNEQDAFRDETALVSNLKMATKVLNAAFSTGELTPQMYENVMKRISSIDAKIVADGSFTKLDELNTVLGDTSKVLDKEVDGGLQDVLQKRQDSIAALDQLQSRLAPAKKEVSTLSASSSVASQYKAVSVVINGKLQAFDQTAIVMNGNTMVPMRGIFEKLGATIKWDQSTKTVTGTKGTTTVVLQIGSKTAKVNGKTVTLTAPATIVNGNTMVPLRFVSESLGADVKWDAKTYTATITLGNVSVPIVDSTQTVQGRYSKLVPQSQQTITQIKTKYGKHSYDVANQTEYDAVIKKVEDAVKGVRTDKLDIGGRADSAYNAYLNGTDKKENYDKSSTNYTFLSAAENLIKPLKDAGVSNADIIKAVNYGQIGSNLIKGIKDPGNTLPQSLYDSLFRALADCDTDAHTFSAVFDAAGFNTAVMSRPGHADVLVEIGGSWWTYNAGTFAKYNKTSADSVGYKVTVASTFGNAVK